MHVLEIERRPALLAAFAALLGVIVAIALVAPAGAAGDAGALAKARSCRDVVVQFEPEGSGGATEIKAKRIKCRKARKVLRSCIKGKLKRGWSGGFDDPKFVLSKGRKRIRFLLVGGGGCIPVAKAREVAEKPKPPKGADRVESFKANLDEKDGKERVLVYNKSKEGFPASWFEVWSQKHGDWVRGQRKLVGQIPSSSEAGLVKAWVKDLNRDGLVEIAVRDFVSPSFGETLSIFRQKSAGSKKFADLQGVGGDQVVVKTRKGKKALLKVFLKSNHSPDNVEHHEIWKWSEQADAWGCSTDCAAIPSASRR